MNKIIYRPLHNSEYEVFSGLYFPIFGLKTGKYGPEMTLYLDTFHAVDILGTWSLVLTQAC